jgi:hypothetical protein
LLLRQAMRLARFLFLLTPFAVVATPGCSLFADDHCSADTRVASATPPLTGPALDQWNHSTCSSAEDDMCKRGIPPASSLELCWHKPDVMTTDAGAFMALDCPSYSTETRCHSSSSDDHEWHH